VLTAVHPEPADEFYADLRACVDQTTRKEAFVFIHGYNVGFETAVRRTAQIAYDLKFEGAAIAYSWPSQEGLLSYTVDETNVDWTVPHLKEFLQGVAQRSGAKSVHLVAHSMGNRALIWALREMVMEQKADCPKFNEVVLTAPDIDADKFQRDLAPAIVNAASRVTLYASSNDEALVASRKVHGYRRAGESGETMVVIPGVDTVDVSEVDTTFVGHSYYGSNSTVLADLFELMQGSKPPDQRKWLQSMKLGALKYWKFLRSRADKLLPGKDL
jgi:esterase/lipase superfamily enzyme